MCWKKHPHLLLNDEKSILRRSFSKLGKTLQHLPIKVSYSFVAYEVAKEEFNLILDQLQCSMILPDLCALVCPCLGVCQCLGILQDPSGAQLSRIPSLRLPAIQVVLMG